MIIPTGNRILLKADPIKTHTASGLTLILNEKLERAAQTNGTIVRLGKDAWEDYDSPWALVGDRVSYIKHAGKWINDPVTDEEFVLLNDIDILAIIEDK